MHEHVRRIPKINDRELFFSRALTQDDAGQQEYRDLAAEVQQHTERQVAGDCAGSTQADHHGHCRGGHVRGENVHCHAGQHEIRRGDRQREHARRYEDLQRRPDKVDAEAGDTRHQHHAHCAEEIILVILVGRWNERTNEIY